MNLTFKEITETIFWNQAKGGNGRISNDLLEDLEEMEWTDVEERIYPPQLIGAAIPGATIRTQAARSVHIPQKDLLKKPKKIHGC